jgi:hypothetical protein
MMRVSPTYLDSMVNVWCAGIESSMICEKELFDVKIKLNNKRGIIDFMALFDNAFLR